MALSPALALRSMPDFEPIAAATPIPEGAGIAVQIRGRSVALFRLGGILFALDNVCPHAGAALAHGRLRDGMIQCPLHGRMFDLHTGRCRNSALGIRPVVVHAVREVDGRVEVALADAPTARPARLHRRHHSGGNRGDG
jgi:3-phenylpropionate/trans-cinnamate dioxygenase ferredoxin subunit